MTYNLHLRRNQPQNRPHPGCLSLSPGIPLLPGTKEALAVGISLSCPLQRKGEKEPFLNKLRGSTSKGQLKQCTTVLTPGPD